MQGLHLTADLRGCAPNGALMTDVTALRSLCLSAVHSVGLQPVGELFHRFTAGTAIDTSSASAARTASVGFTSDRARTHADAPVGITGVVLLAESHLAVHTWPEIGSVTLDVYVCNFGADNSSRAQALMGCLVAAFEPAQIHSHALRRGQPASSP